MLAELAMSLKVVCYDMGQGMSLQTWHYSRHTHSSSDTVMCIAQKKENDPYYSKLGRRESDGLASYFHGTGLLWWAKTLCKKGIEKGNHMSTSISQWQHRFSFDHRS
jgi:hypothetical protein